MVRARRRDARRDHVAVADRLDLLEVVPLGQRVEVAEQVVEDADDLGGRQAFRQRREVDDVGEQDRRRAELVGDRLRLRLEPVGDRAGEDVEQQVLGSLLLVSQRGQRVRALLGERRQQREDDRAADGDVEREHRAREPLGHLGLDAAEQLAGDPRAEEHDHERDVPANPARTPLKTSAPSGARMPHRPTPAASRNPPSGIIERVGASRIATWATRSSWANDRACGEDEDRAQQDCAVGQWHVADRRSEGQVEDRPQQCDREDQHRDEDEQRLVGARVLVVSWIRTDGRQAFEDAGGDGPAATDPLTRETVLGLLARRGFHLELR